jgi:hypothetical protein
MSHAIPSCYGEGAPMLDDCLVSCAYWEDCIHDHEEMEEEDDRLLRMKPIHDRCDACQAKEQCGGCMAHDLEEVCSGCEALSQSSNKGETEK